MSQAVTLIFPHQLFQNHPALEAGRDIYLVEEWLFFKQFNFHKHKLVLHRASMKFYENWLRSKGFTVNYIETNDPANDCRTLIAKLSQQQTSAVHIAALADDWLLQRIQKNCKQYGIELKEYPSPNFINTRANTDAFFNSKKSYFQTDFYTWQRKQRNILLEPDGKPLGGKWTFDAENRQKFPKKENAPLTEFPPENQYILEAKTYVNKYFPKNYGDLKSPCLFVVTFEDAQQWLQLFLQKRFQLFGLYEDAIVAKERILYHSVLTPMLNIGLLQPQQIINEALEASTKYAIPINSTEGFIRQIIGWREFIHLIYEREGRKQRSTNYWKFKRKIPAQFWTGETGIPPIDITIKKTLQTGYCHHIERLMVLGNFMLLCEFDPDEVYSWFMELFIDAYDWVMVPNVYGMTQFADGGIMTTKPYISGSNYLMKMSDYEKGEWQAIWDGLFWRFMHEYRSFFLKNPRLGMLINSFDKMSAEKQQIHLSNAAQYLQSLDQSVKE